ncbi:MAG: ribonuclease III [Ruminococcus sp.]|nr:ribonuclease III [Ruminococcus sp.]
MSERDAGQYSPLALAFLGDSVYDTLVRDYLLRRANMPVAKLHTAKIKLVCAEFQSSVYENVAEILTEKEISVLKRGRNSTGNTVPKHAEAVDYRRATAIECLFGYLFLTGQEERISQIFNVIMENVLPEF